MKTRRKLAIIPLECIRR